MGFFFKIKNTKGLILWPKKYTNTRTNVMQVNYDNNLRIITQQYGICNQY